YPQTDVARSLYAHHRLAASIPSLAYMSCLLLFNDPTPPDIYTLSLHDALPISQLPRPFHQWTGNLGALEHAQRRRCACSSAPRRSEEHTSELQSPYDLVCRLLLEKKKKNNRKRSKTSHEAH